MSFTRPAVGWIAALSRIGAVAAALLAATAAAASAASIAVFPIPGSRVAAPGAQIVFRGVSARTLGAVSVTGSRSGRHSGRIMGDSDGDGASFLPARPFTAGESVTVATAQTVLGGRGATFSFRVANPAAGAVIPMHVVGLKRHPGDVVTFRSRPDLQPVRVSVLRNTSSATGGDIFLGPQVGPLQNGPMIVDPSGQLVWFTPVPAGAEANNVSVQEYRGRPVLTWWQGYLDLRIGVGVGSDWIEDTAYHRLTVVRAADGLSADLHEFQLTPRGTALITAYYPVWWDARSVHGTARQIVLDAVIQEIDVRTGLLLFQWDSLDHVPLTATEIGLTKPTGDFDYFHVNSIQDDGDGTLIVSGRNTWAAYKISRTDGRVLWTLGGRNSSFAMGPGAAFAFQHDVRSSGGDAAVTVFDDGAGPPSVHDQSRAVALRLDTVHHTAVLAADFTHSPSLLSHYEGGVEPLADGDDFVGWGEQPYFTEFNPAGQIVLDGRFGDGNTTYRAFRSPWTGTPHTRPVLAMSSKDGHSTVYASWNGATLVTTWRVLTGPSPRALKPAGTFARSGFETAMRVTRRSYGEVQALDASGRVLATSTAIKSR